MANDQVMGIRYMAVAFENLTDMEASLADEKYDDYVVVAMANGPSEEKGKPWVVLLERADIYRHTRK